MRIRVTIDTLRREIAEIQENYPTWTKDNAFVHWFLQAVYGAALAFFRARGGSGAEAVDISNFFYRPHQHTRFQSFWKSGKNSRRRTEFRKALKAFSSALREALVV